MGVLVATVRNPLLRPCAKLTCGLSAQITIGVGGQPTSFSGLRGVPRRDTNTHVKMPAYGSSLPHEWMPA